MSKKILGIGNAIVDVFVKVDDFFLSKKKPYQRFNETY